MSIGESTLLYLSVFLLTCLSTGLAEKNINRKKNNKAVFYSALAVFIPSLLAGVRGDTVGRDVLEYAVRTFDYAKQSTSFSQMQELSGEPIGYNILAYVTSWFFDDTGYFLFGSQFMVVLPVYIVAYKNRKEYPMWLVMCCYMFLFYNGSFNVMKQSVSSAFILLCYCYLKEKKYVPATITFILAFAFHFSAMFGLLFILLSRVVSGKHALASRITLVLVFLFIVIFLKNISQYLLSSGIMPEKYTRNIDAVFNMDKHVYLRIKGFNKHVFMDWIFRTLLVILPPISVIRVKRDIDENANIVAILGFVFYTYVLVAFSTAYGGRISMYCDFFWMLTVPALEKSFSQRSLPEKVAADTVIVGFLGIYWFLWIMLHGMSGSNHFVFRF